MAISSDGANGSLPSSRTENPEGQSLVVPSSNLCGCSSSLPIEKVYSESRDNLPSNFDGFSSISTITGGSDKTLDGSLSSALAEVQGEHYFYSQPENSNRSSSVIPVIPDGQISVPLLSNAEVLHDQSLLDAPVESRDLESVVSSYGCESSPSSPSDPLEGQYLVPLAVDPSPREALLDEVYRNDRKSAMQMESKENTSSLSVSWDPHREKRNERNCDDNELNHAKDEPIFELSYNSPYHFCYCDRYHRIRPCGPHCNFYSPFYDPWHASGRRWGAWGYGRENRPLSFSLPVATGVGAGLSNLGNTCFINAILQCFTHTVPFVKALRSLNHSSPCQRGFEGFCVVCVLRDHIELSLASSGKIISPSQVVDNLNHISSCFHRYQQEDAHEFLQCLLDKLERCCLDSNPNEISSSEIDNIVEQVFGGRLVSKLRCFNCGHCSDKYEPLIDLSLEIEDGETLQRALESFTKVENIEDTETKFRCDNCKEEVSMEKQLMLDQAPSVAALHLKRFKTDGSSIEKIGKHVPFPLELDLRPYTNGSQESYEPQAHLKYQLYAIVVHNGFLPTSGHYFCYIRSSSTTWHKLDDSMVIEVEEEMVLSQAAYILFYVREGVPWFSSLMDTQKEYLCPTTSNTSPNSVLDNMETESAAYPPEENIDLCKGSGNRGDAEGTSTLMSCVSMVEEAQMNQIGNDAEGTPDPISYGSRCTGAKLCCDETSDDAPMNDVSVLFEVEATSCSDGICHNEKSGALHHAEENNSGQVVHRIGRNGVRDPITPPRSSSPEKNFREQPEARHYTRRDHLNVNNSVSSRKMKKSTRDQRIEALRYIKKNTPASRGLKLLAAMPPMHPQHDKKRRIRSSPCKQGSPPGSHSKLICRQAVLR